MSKRRRAGAPEPPAPCALGAPPAGSGARPPPLPFSSSLLVLLLFSSPPSPSPLLLVLGWRAACERRRQDDPLAVLDVFVLGWPCCPRQRAGTAARGPEGRARPFSVNSRWGVTFPSVAEPAFLGSPTRSCGHRPNSPDLLPYAFSLLLLPNLPPSSLASPLAPLRPPRPHLLLLLFRLLLVLLPPSPPSSSDCRACFSNKCSGRRPCCCSPFQSS